MAGRRFTDKEKKFRAMLREGICKARLSRWFSDAGLSESEKDIMFRIFLKQQSREQVALDTFTCKGTVSRKVTSGINKLMDYFDFTNSSTDSKLE